MVTGTALPRVGRMLRRLPAGLRGKARVARWLLARRLGVGDVVIDALHDVRFIVPNLLDPVGFHLFIDGVYEPLEIDWILNRLAPGDVYVDVGANIGALAVPAAKRVGASGRVVAIEASPCIAEYLNKNIALNELSNVTVCCIAADSSTESSVPFYVASAERFGMGALTPQYGGTATPVQSMRLDDLLASLNVDRVHVLKIDVEGFEVRVLAGAQKLLRGQNPPAVLFEYYDWAERSAATPGDAQRLLLDCGYRLWMLDGWLRNEAPLAACVTGGQGGNMVAIHKDQR